MEGLNNEQLGEVVDDLNDEAVKWNSFKSVLPLDEVAKDYIPDKKVFPIGFEKFDYAMDGGLRLGELITISAQSGQGKTTFCQQLTGNFIKNDIPCLWFSYEMNPYYLLDNFLKAKIDTKLIYAPISLDIDVVKEIKGIEYLIIKARKHYGCKIVFIDHLHYLVPLNQSVNISLMIGGIVRELKQVAVRNDIIIFLVAHSKKIYQGEKVDISSIRDSGLIVNESDYVFLLERKKKESKASYEQSDTEWLNETKISLAKNRRTGDMRFINCSHSDRKFIEITNEYEKSSLPPMWTDSDNL